MINTTFWFSNPSILYEKNSILEFFPSKKFDIVRKLNAILRLSIVYTIIMYLCTKNNKYLLIPVVTALVTWFIWSRQTDIQTNTLMSQSISNQLDDLVRINDLNTTCRVPTKDNPFMNPYQSEFSNENVSESKACPSYNNVGVQNRMNELFNEDLYRDVKDVFGKNNSQRQFYTVPGNQVPNDQESFGQWLYGTPPTCKEGNQKACLNQLGRGSSNAKGGG